MTLRVGVDPASAVPPFEQLRAQIADAVLAGVLPAGTRLPSVRQLAGDLGLAPGTVARAYRALEADGLVLAAGRRGTTVAPGAATAGSGAIEAAARAFLSRVRALGGDVDAAVAAVRAAAGDTS